MSDSQVILSARDTPPTTHEVLETVRKHLNTLGGAPDGATLHKYGLLAIRNEMTLWRAGKSGTKKGRRL